MIGFAFALLLQAPIDLEVEQQPSLPPNTPPVLLNDHTADFRARHPASAPATARRYQIQVSTNSVIGTGPDLPTHWNSPSSGNVTRIPGADPAPGQMVATEFAYGRITRTQIQNAPLLDWNTTYYWRIRYSLADTNASLQAAPWSDVASFVTPLPPSGISSSGGNGAPSGNSWRYIGVPIDVGSTVPASELLDDTGPNLLRFDEPTRTWVIVGPTDLLLGGRGYIFPAVPGVSLDLGQGKMASGRQRIPLTRTTTADNTWRGNNLICNPFALPIRWRRPAAGGQIRANTNASALCYQWNGSAYGTVHAANGTITLGANPILDPYRAVGVIATGGGAFIDIDEPPPTSGGSLQSVGSSGDRTLLAPPPPFDSVSWSLKIRADSASSTFSESFAGVLPESSDDEDVNDGVELNGEDPANPSAPWILANFDHPDWTANPGLFVHDLRASRFDAGDRVSWTLSVTGNTNAPVTLTWPNLADLPSADWSWSLEDPSTGDVYDLSTTPSFATGPVDSPTNGPVELILHADRLTSFVPQLLLSASGAPAPAAASEGDAEVELLSFDLVGAGEPVTVTSLRLTHQGTGDATKVAASLLHDGVVAAGPTAFAGGEIVWSGLSLPVDHQEAGSWTVAFDFQAGAAGTHGVTVESADTASHGTYSLKTATVAGGPLASGLVAVSAAPAPPSGGSGGGCGLLGFEVGLLLLGAGLLRRSTR